MVRINHWLYLLFEITIVAITIMVAWQTTQLWVTVFCIIGATSFLRTTLLHFELMDMPGDEGKNRLVCRELMVTIGFFTAAALQYYYPYTDAGYYALVVALLLSCLVVFH